MMGHGHATMGAAAWVALVAPAPFGFSVLSLDPVGVAVGAVATAGAALLPDADHHNGTIAHALPPVTTVMTGAIEGISGGHRHATHSLVGAAVFAVGAYALSFPRIVFQGREVQIGSAVLLLFLATFALKALKITHKWFDAWLLSLAVAAALTWYAPDQYWWLPLSVGVGAVIHLLGDLLTVQGLALFWPFVPKPPVATPFWKENGYMSVPVLGTAGSGREWLFVVLIDVYLLWALLSMYAPDFLPWLWEQARA